MKNGDRVVHSPSGGEGVVINDHFGGEQTRMVLVVEDSGEMFWAVEKDLEVLKEQNTNG